MDADAHLEISRHLEAGERVLWAGKPKQGLRLRGSDVYMIPLSFLWCAFCFYSAKSALSIGGSFLIATLGVMMGIYGTVGRFSSTHACGPRHSTV